MEQCCPRGSTSRLWDSGKKKSSWRLEVSRGSVHTATPQKEHSPARQLRSDNVLKAQQWYGTVESNVHQKKIVIEQRWCPVAET